MRPDNAVPSVQKKNSQRYLGQVTLIYSNYEIKQYYSELQVGYKSAFNEVQWSGHPYI